MYIYKPSIHLLWYQKECFLKQDHVWSLPSLIWMLYKHAFHLLLIACSLLVPSIRIWKVHSISFCESNMFCSQNVLFELSFLGIIINYLMYISIQRSWLSQNIIPVRILCETETLNLITTLWWRGNL